VESSRQPPSQSEPVRALAVVSRPTWPEASVSPGKIFLDLQALAFNGFYTNSGIQKSIRRDT